MAVRFQCPVILLTDKEINLTTTTTVLEDVAYPGTLQPVVPVPHPLLAPVLFVTGQNPPMTNTGVSPKIRIKSRR